MNMVNMVVRRTYGTKRKEETGNWRKLHNEELHDLHSSTNINEQIKVKDDMGRACGMNAGNDQCIQGFGEKK
jgi:hypothetical protein